jgi:hypothetical protein
VILEALDGTPDGISADSRRKIVHDAAARLYGLDT